MTFLIDAQLPPALAAHLSRAGHAASHVEDYGLRHADDGEIWRFALEQEMVLVTKDEDFPLRRLRAKTGLVIVWLRVGNASTRELWSWLEPLLPRLLDCLTRGEPMVELK